MSEILLYTNAKKGFRFFLEEDSQWTIKGRYSAITEAESTSDNEVEWTTNDRGKNEIHILCISFY